MSKHTPGPWVASLTLGYGEAGEHGIPIAREKDDLLVAHVYGAANARLIAAAPDLLEALELVVDITERAGLGAVLNARAAIAKAKGESK